MPKAFSEVPKRIYSAGRKEINILNNHRKELLKEIKHMKDENKFLLKEQKHLRRLLKEYQDEGEPYTILLKENQFEIQSTKNSLNDLKQKFCEVQNLKNQLNAEMVACNCQMVTCKKLLRLETKLGSLEVLKKKLKKFTKESDIKDETIRLYRLRVSRLSEEHEKESNDKDQEAEILKDKLMEAHDRLSEMKAKYDNITRKICNTHHHYHPDHIEEKRPRKKKTEFSQSLGSKNKPTKKKIKTKSHRIVSSTPLKSSKSNSTSTKHPPGQKTPSNESLVRKSGKSKLIHPSIGVSCMPPQTSFKLADMITLSITDTVTSDLMIATSDSSITTSDLGRSILTPDVSEKIDSIEQNKASNSMTSDFETTTESFCSRQATDTGTTAPIMDDCNLQHTPIHSPINSLREEKPTETKDEQVLDHKINDEVCEQFKNLDISEDDNKSNYGMTMNDTSIDIEKHAHGIIIRHDKCHEPKPNSEHRKQSIKKSQVISKHCSRQIKTQARKVYRFNETVEHLHHGTPTGSPPIKKTNQ